MAASCEEAVAASSESDGGGKGFGSWLDGWLEVLGVDQAIYGAYILGVLQEEEEEEKLDALQGILSAFLEEDSLLDICKEIVKRWSETQNVVTQVKKDEVQAIAILIKKQAQIVVKPKVVSEEEKRRKAALMAQYASVTEEENEADEKYDSGAMMMSISSDKSLFRNTNVKDVFKAWKSERDSLQDESQRKKEQDKLQKERNKLAKQERKEKKKAQRGARKR
uniref:Coiled-coil domain-containing protein 43 n=1 Tax=Sciurus vulgaris TaxID=55149 RepID=A0A8D2CZN9_SCIVU